MPISGSSSSGMSGDPTPPECPPCKNCPPPKIPGVTKSPVRFFNGGAIVSDVDLVVPGGGWFGQVREYGNQAAFSYDGPCGFNWWVGQLPYAVGINPPGMASPTAVAIVFDSNNPYWFDVDLPTGVWTPRYGLVDVSLVADSVNHTLRFSRSTGQGAEVTVFNDTSHPTAPGAFVSQTDARGVLTTVFSRTGNRINELRRSVTVGGTTTVESLTYDWDLGSFGTPKVTRVTYSRSSVARRRVEYAYHGLGATGGSLGDLKTATRQEPDGLGGWNDVGVCYYRYHQAGSAVGFAHGLKLRFGPEAYRALWNLYGSQSAIDAASDAAVKPYADHYFEYDPATRAVTQEVAAVCDTCPGGGTTSDTFAYAVNPADPPFGYNVWSYRTTQTLPDNSQVVVYSNGYGQTMLYVQKDPAGATVGITFARYDAQGRVDWLARPSACTGYDETKNDLMDFNVGTGKYAYLKDTDGLIEQTEYVSGGAADGQVAVEKLRRGQSPSTTVVTLRSYTYTSHADANGVTVTPVATATQYPDDSSTATTITTSYSYAWYAGTNVLSQRTTTLPVVSTGQNGSGVADTVVEDYDALGQLAQRTDERGVVTRYEYDPMSGLPTKQTLNYQSGGSTAPGVNVVTEYAYDDQGRPTATLGPPHEAVVGGTATTVRAATWTVYVPSARPVSGTWGLDEVRTGRGYATGTAPSYTYALVDPVTLSRTDKDGRTIDRITSKRTSGSGALSASDTFAQSDWKSWSSTQYDARHRTVSARVYHLIPSSGTGSAGTNYGQADYGYDALERRNRVKSPEGTITRTVWTTPQRVASVWVGTDDTGATDANPAGSGAPNNLVVVTANQYDGGSLGGDGNLTQFLQYVSAADTRVTIVGYDWRDRRTSVDGEVDGFWTHSYDNLGRLTKTDRRDTNSAGTLVSRTETKYDDRGRVYRTLTYAVDPATGTVGNALTGDMWFDPSGNMLQTIREGDGGVFTKSSYNNVGWVTATYRGYNTSGVNYSQAATVANDTIFAQTEATYDAAGNAVAVASYDRLNDAPATGTGSTGPLSYASNPKARVSYTATWYDGIDRPYASANYGAISSFTRPSTPTTRSDTELVTSTEYDDAGRAWKTIDPRGTEARTAFDAAGRTTQTVEAYSASTADDLNRTTNYTYTLDNQVATMTAVNGRTGDQTTTYTYGTTLAESGVARNDLLRHTDYPGSVSGSDRTANTYNRLGQARTFADQRGTVRTFYYDKLGRPTNDCVTTDGTGTDVAVKQIATAYDVRGLVATVTSTDSATQGAGTVLNQCRMTYNGFGQLIKEEQAHAGAATTGTPAVQYGYASGASGSNQIRPVGLTYPDGKQIDYGYDASGTPDDRLSRVNRISDVATDIVAYAYVGIGTVVRITYLEPQVWLDLWGGTSGTFAGLDRFGRVVDQRWQNAVTTTPVDIDRYQYGYDRNSNRTWKRNVVSTAASVPLDEFYAYDQLNRLTNMKRGRLTGTPPSGVAETPAVEQDWTLDPTGNWRGYATKTAGTTDLDQARASNAANQITGITESTGPSWADPAYDAAGNTTTCPQPTVPMSTFTATYDAWNRMTGVTSGGTDVAKYEYDGQDRRVVSKNYAAGALAETRYAYFTGGWQNVEERVGTATTADTQHVWGMRHIDDLVCRDDPANGRLQGCQDANFNVTSVVDGSAGGVLQRFAYGPYGTTRVLTPSWLSTVDSYSWTHRFHCGDFDRSTQLANFRNRWFDPGLGRWMRRDPDGYADGANLYEFVRSSPGTHVDPYGLGTGRVTYNCASLAPVGAVTGRGLLGVATGACTCSCSWLPSLAVTGAMAGAVGECCKASCVAGDVLGAGAQPGAISGCMVGVLNALLPQFLFLLDAEVKCACT